MKKITAFLLALVMALSLAACGSKDDSKQLVGTWQCALDLTEKMDEEMAANLGTEYTSEVPVSLYLTTVFNEDGTFSMSPDLDATTESLNAYIQALKPALVELLYKEAEAPRHDPRRVRQRSGRQRPHRGISGGQRSGAL